MNGSALQAARHTNNRQVEDILLNHGAREKTDEDKAQAKELDSQGGSVPDKKRRIPRGIFGH